MAKKNDSYSDIPLEQIEKIDWDKVGQMQMVEFAEALRDVNASIEKSKKSKDNIVFRLTMLAMSVFFTVVFGYFMGPWVALAGINVTLVAGVVSGLWQRRVESNVVQSSHDKLSKVVGSLGQG